MSSCSHLQGTFPTQGLNPDLPHCRRTLYQLSHQGSPRILEWVAFPFLQGIFLTQELNQDLFHCRQIFYQLSYCSVRFSSVAQSCPTHCDPMKCSTPGLPVHHKLPEFTQTHAHRVGDAIQTSHPLWSPSPPTPNPSQHQGLFLWVNSSHEVAEVLEFQLQHQSFQWTPRTDLL